MTSNADEIKTSATQALLKRLLAEKLTQSEISRRTGIPQPRISRWAAGDVAAGADDALKLQELVNELDRAQTEVIKPVALELVDTRKTVGA